MKGSARLVIRQGQPWPGTSGGAYTLTGTIGQPDAGTLRSGGNTYTLAGGFWPSLAQTLHDLFLPLLRR